MLVLELMLLGSEVMVEPLCVLIKFTINRPEEIIYT